MLIVVATEVSAASITIVKKTSPARTTGDTYCATIQEAVNIAEGGDIIIVCPGTYRENVEVNKSVDIRSYDGASNTVIRAYDISKSVFHVTSQELHKVQSYLRY